MKTAKSCHAMPAYDGKTAENSVNKLGEQRFQALELEQEMIVSQVEFDRSRTIDQDRSRIFLNTCSISSLEKARAGTSFNRFAERSSAANVSLLNPAEEIGAGRSSRTSSSG
ncbi:MAG: hypothetical protein V4693_13045 [Pseudomonadota bacterium]